MYGLVVWLNEETTIPSLVGPYEDDEAFSDAMLLMSCQCYKVQVCTMTAPENSETLKFLKRVKTSKGA